VKRDHSPLSAGGYDTTRRSNLPPSPPPESRISHEGINDEIVSGVVDILERSGNRPHTVKELAAVLAPVLGVVEKSVPSFFSFPIYSYFLYIYMCFLFWGGIYFGLLFFFSLFTGESGDPSLIAVPLVRWCGVGVVWVCRGIVVSRCRDDVSKKKGKEKVVKALTDGFGLQLG